MSPNSLSNSWLHSWESSSAAGGASASPDDARAEAALSGGEPSRRAPASITRFTSAGSASFCAAGPGPCGGARSSESRPCNDCVEDEAMGFIAGCSPSSSAFARSWRRLLMYRPNRMLQAHTMMHTVMIMRISAMLVPASVAIGPVVVVKTTSWKPFTTMTSPRDHWWAAWFSLRRIMAVQISMPQDPTIPSVLLHRRAWPSQTSSPSRYCFTGASASVLAKVKPGVAVSSK
mmetsp:Transcript_52264/g.144739  ORF Transcript_52264/g.144739 Transcript_52264/m.144739 type:complete len:232 (-) Transcript_52264:294-989(-)